MKQGTIKTLGVAAIGAAFAATAAGSAAAAEPVQPVTSGNAGLLSTLPVDQAGDMLSPQANASRPGSQQGTDLLGGMPVTNGTPGSGLTADTVGDAVSGGSSVLGG
ncbi:hypothetical protein [Streptomyces sp. NPDC003077]|uniref:hypothetical protein n=1 Tax=Streptomyces sp. NPDC003077 TaxID=3154443 RepID=UPI0033A87874